jgi:hypothetical protein
MEAKSGIINCMEENVSGNLTVAQLLYVNGDYFLLYTFL